MRDLWTCSVSSTCSDCGGCQSVSTKSFAQPGSQPVAPTVSDWRLQQHLFARLASQPVGSLIHALAWHALQEYIDISGTRMSCCDNQSQADEGPTLPPFLQFSKRFMQFDLNRPRGSARMLDETGEEASSQPDNIL